MVRAKYKESIIGELEVLSVQKQKEVLDFIHSLKVFPFLDFSQLYFWSKKWQAMEKEAEEDLKRGRVKRFSGVKELLDELARKD